MEIIKGNLYKSKIGELVVMAEKEKNEFFFSGQVVVGYGDGEKGKFSIGWIKEAFQPYSAEIIIKEVIDFSKVQFIEMHDGEVVFASGNHSGDRFTATSLKVSHFQFYEKSEAKRVVTPKFE
jgi:hypothetical protein